MAHILITGHSRGLGSALATALLAQGHDVLGVSRGPLTEGHAPCDRLEQVSVDLADAQTLEAFLSSGRIEAFFKPCKQAVIINNAGLLEPIGYAGNPSSASIIRAVTVNVAAALALSNAFVAATAHVNDRRMIQVSSGAARSPYAGWGIYCATKASLDHYVRCLALENHAGLKAESLAPGVIDTDMQAQVRATSLEQFPMRGKFDDLKRSGALASPQSVALKMITHLFSQDFGRQSGTDLRQLYPA